MTSQPVASRDAADDGVRRPARLRHAPPARRRPLGHTVRVRRTVARPRLLAPLIACPQRLAVLVAPAGWGKTTVLAQWAAADPRPFVVVALTEAHDDPDVLAVALEGAMSAARPCILALDGLHVLTSPESCALVTRLAEQVPARTTLALASRRDPDVPLGRRRAHDDVVELRADRLALTAAEARELLHCAAPGLTDREAGRLVELTGGWPAALWLAARAVADLDRPAAPDAFDGEDTTVRDYVREEVLGALPAQDRAFLRRVSVVDPLTGPACDAALAQDGSAERLRRLARAGEQGVEPVPGIEAIGRGERDARASEPP